MKRPLKHDEVAALFRYRMGRPDLDDIPDEWVADTFDFRSWMLGEAFHDLGLAIMVELRRLPLVGKMFR
jgi:hypothetical protein